MWLRFSSRALDIRLLVTIICIAHAHPLAKLLGLLVLFLSPTTWRIRFGELGRFYIAILILSFASSLYFFTHLERNYLFALVIGLFFWVVCLLIHSMIYESVTQHSVKRTERTVRVFFYILFATSFAQYVEHVLLGPASDSILRVLAVGGVGDHLMSVYTFSSDAMLVYGILTFYFIHKRWWKLVLLSVLALLWTNFMSGILTFLVAWVMYLIFFRSLHFIVRSVVVVLGVVSLFLLVYMNWDNFNYAYELITQVADGNLVARKLSAHLQTLSYATSGPKELLLGAGMGNFSSRLAFLTAGEYVDWFPSALIYRHELFTQSHFSLWNDEILSANIIGLDGTINQPFSVYNQLIGEYGLLGCMLFVVFYLGFFLRRWKLLLPTQKALFFFMLGFLFLDYWFEYFSTLVVFEWIMLLSMRSQRAHSEPQGAIISLPREIQLTRPFSKKISLSFLFKPKSSP